MNRYDLGIGEYSEMASIVTIFAELEIETTINISPSIFLTHFLEFLEVDLSNICIPDVNNVHRHDGLPNSEICVKGKSNLAEQTLSKQKHYYKTYYEKCIKSDLKGKIKLQDIEEPQNIEIAKNLRQKFHPLKLIKNIKCCFINQHELGNSKNYSNCNKIDLKEKIKLQNIEEMEKSRQKFHPLELFKKIEYHFVNQHELGNFRNYPKHDKIVYIGGILIEERGILNKSKIPVNPQDHKCVVLFSTGTAVNFVKEDRKNIEDMFKIFSTFDDCKFIVRIKKSIIPEVYSKNIEIFDSKYEANEIKSDNHKKISKQELIDQQGILG
uniref:Glucuronosyltransferase n=1 Tax=Meloidogyne hapla TaxID=6305 RepID=A0A1I8BHT4_MELHA